MNRNVFLTSTSDDGAVVLPVNIDGTGNDGVKGLGSSLNLLLGFCYGLLGTLDLDLGASRWAGSVASTRDINLSASLDAQSIKLATTRANEGRKLGLSDRHDGLVGIVDNVLQKTKKLVTSLVGASTWASYDNLVRTLV